MLDHVSSFDAKALGKSFYTSYASSVLVRFLTLMICLYSPGWNFTQTLERLLVWFRFTEFLPPRIGLRFNTDGLSKYSPGPSVCGGVFRDYKGSFIGGFATSLGIQSSFFAEVMADVIFAVEEAWSKSWYKLWIECNSVHCLKNRSFGWQNFPYLLN